MPRIHGIAAEVLQGTVRTRADRTGHQEHMGPWRRFRHETAD